MAKEEVTAPMEENLARFSSMDFLMSNANEMFSTNGTTTLKEAMKYSFFPAFFMRLRSVLTPEMNKKYMKPIKPMLVTKKLTSSGNKFSLKFLLWPRTDGPMIKPPFYTQQTIKYSTINPMIIIN